MIINILANIMNSRNYEDQRDRFIVANSHRNSDHFISPMGKNRSSSGSLNRYTKSPYLQKFTQGFSLPKKNQSNNPSPNTQMLKHPANYQTTHGKAHQMRQTVENKTIRKDARRSHSNSRIRQEPRNGKFKLPKIEIEKEKADIKEKTSMSSLSATLELSKKKKLSPIKKAFKMETVVKTKAGTNGKQLKINQDIAIVETALPQGVKFFCVCDGHGLNGHLVSAFIKSSVIKHLKSMLKKYKPENGKISDVLEEALEKTNDELLNCDINTELSGSTVIAVFIHHGIIYSFNIGDSRAILASNRNQTWSVKELSIDQKPERQDERQRILKFGGRIEAQKDARGQDIGPLRVWMKDVHMPGLAMTRSFGDKAGRKAGTNGDSELISHKIEESDKFMVLASDGVWQYLQNEEVMGIVVPFYSENDYDLAGEKLLKISVQIWQKTSYSRDDITLILVVLNPLSGSVLESEIKMEESSI